MKIKNEKINQSTIQGGHTPTCACWRHTSIMVVELATIGWWVATTTKGVVAPTSKGCTTNSVFSLRKKNLGGGQLLPLKFFFLKKKKNKRKHDQVVNRLCNQFSFFFKKNWVVVATLYHMGVIRPSQYGEQPQTRWWWVE